MQILGLYYKCEGDMQKI